MLTTIHQYAAAAMAGAMYCKLIYLFFITDETPVPVANCNAKEYNANPKQVMPFKEFIHYWREYIQNGHSSPKGCLYLKDWHMSRYQLILVELKFLFHKSQCAKYVTMMNFILLFLQGLS